MKLQNKKTGEIGVLNVSNNKYYVIAYGLPLCGNSVLGEYDTLDALMQEWEDYEETKSDIIDFSNVRLPVVEIHRKVRDCSNKKADLIISLDQKTGVLIYRVVNKKLGYDFVYTPLEFGYVAWTIIGEGKE